MMTDEISDILQRLEDNREQGLERLFELVRIKSVSADPAFADECRRAAEMCRRMLEETGFEARIIDTAGHPVALGHFIPQEPLSGMRILFYGHYDVQPPDPLELWRRDPFDPAIEDDPENGEVIVGRGACDDKGQLMTFMEALRAIINQRGEPPCPITVLIEGEEESGSPSLDAFLKSHEKELAADIAIVCDTNMWDRRTPAITTMLRGLANVEMTVEGPSMDLHSGHFGGAARNPLHVLCDILASARNEDGRILIPGFYDGVMEDAELLESWRGLDFDEKGFLASIGLSMAAGEKDRSLLEQIWSRPTMEVNGLSGGYQGEGVKTVIPARAGAKISFRLVPGQNPRAILDNFKSFAQKRLPADCRLKWKNESASPAIAFDPSSPPFRIAARELEREFSRPPAMIGCGASIPVVASFHDILGLDAMLIGFGLDDDRIHSPNEKYNMSSFVHGSRSFARIIMALARISQTGNRQGVRDKAAF
jgi:acetylornithine deacetylase/succinyl-diaminopimelate desuccinylase-like protein